MQLQENAHMDTASWRLCFHHQYSALHTVQVCAHTAAVHVGPIGKVVFLLLVPYGLQRCKYRRARWVNAVYTQTSWSHRFPYPCRRFPVNMYTHAMSMQLGYAHVYIQAQAKCRSPHAKVHKLTSYTTQQHSVTFFISRWTSPVLFVPLM